MPFDRHDCLELATACAREAAERLRQAATRPPVIEAAPGHDLKLAADRESEAFLRAALEPSGLPIIGEEEGGDARLVDGDRPYWIVDPLDGTHNFALGVPHCAVSIGLWRGRTPVLGVVHDVFRDEAFVALNGEGAWLDGEPLRPSWPQKRDEAVLHVGFPADGDFSDAGLARVFATIRAYRKYRLMGSAALALAYVAAGRADVYSEAGIYLWDIAAGVALVQAVGGVVRMRPYPGKRLGYTVLAAGRVGLLPAAAPGA